MRFVFPIMIRRVQGHSMLPILPPGTLVYGWRWFVRLKVQQVIIFARQQKEIVKRIDSINGDELFVLGDHPDASTDSRHYGPVVKESVQAVVVWPRTRKVAAQSVTVAARPKDSEA